uniref:Uncharacterized protein n=1 Tax=Anguilla anguilla TaxID=7936 RepID=A0A0E9PIX4_ANGAN
MLHGMLSYPNRLRFILLTNVLQQCAIFVSMKHNDHYMFFNETHTIMNSMKQADLITRCVSFKSFCIMNCLSLSTLALQA